MDATTLCSCAALLVPDVANIRATRGTGFVYVPPWKTVARRISPNSAAALVPYLVLRLGLRTQIIRQSKPSMGSL